MMGTISVPSWVIPGTYLENLRFLEDKREVSGVELLFFLYDGKIRKMFDDEWKEILRYRERFVFTAHLPDRLLPEHRELVERLAPLSRHFIIHPGLPGEAPELASLVNRWAAEFPQCHFLAENTGPGMIEALLPHLNKNLGLCMDTGHLLLEGTDPVAWFACHRERTEEIHLHDVDRNRAALDGKLPDHRPLTAEAAWFKKLRPLLEEFPGLINMEVFSWEEVRQSITAFLSG